VAGAASWGGPPGPRRTPSSAHRQADQRARYPFGFVPSAVRISTCSSFLILLELCLNWVRSVIFGSPPVRPQGRDVHLASFPCAGSLILLGLCPNLGLFRNFCFSGTFVPHAAIPGGILRAWRKPTRRVCDIRVEPRSSSEHGSSARRAAKNEARNHSIT
jgi:hypothetical protein